MNPSESASAKTEAAPPALPWWLALICRLLAALPESLATALGRALGALLYHGRFRRRVVMRQMQVAYGTELDDAAVARLARAHYRHLGLFVLELLRLPAQPRPAIAARYTVTGEEHAQAALAQGKGILALYCHLGNWEMLGACFAERGYQLAVIGKALKTGVGQVFLEALRAHCGVKFLAKRHSLPDIIRCLRANQPVAFVMDQNVTLEEGLFVSFFGQPACTLKGLALLAERTGAVILPTYGYRAADNRHHQAVILPPVALEFPHADREANLLHNTQRLTTILEGIIRQHPEQWLWLHKRWKTRPPGETVNPFA